MIRNKSYICESMLLQKLATPHITPTRNLPEITLINGL